MSHALDALDRVGQIRDAACATSPGPSFGEVSVKGLRLPPATREAIRRAIDLRCSWGPVPMKLVPIGPKAMASEIERDIALLAHELAQEARLSPPFARYLALLAEGLTALSQAYNKRLEGGPEK